MEAGAAQELADVFKALADPTRVAIVNRLARGETCCVCDLTAAFELSQPTVSHHLRILRDAGLVESERRGTFAYYRLVPEAIEQLRSVFDRDEATFGVLLVCPGGGPGTLDTAASFTGGRLPIEGEEIEVLRSDGSRARALVRLVDTDDEPPITAALAE